MALHFEAPHFVQEYPLSDNHSTISLWNISRAEPPAIIAMTIGMANAVPAKKYVTQAQ